MWLLLLLLTAPAVGAFGPAAGQQVTRAVAPANYLSSLDPVGQQRKQPQTELEPESGYKWENFWYPVSYSVDIEDGPRPHGVSVFDEPLVLWRDSTGSIQAARDVCPHRASKLSDGQVTNEGNIECLYHGWQFKGATGQCTAIPQLDKGASIPRQACIQTYPVAEREGVVFVWMGEPGAPISPAPSTLDNLDQNEALTFLYQFVIELPYDWSFLAENLLDPAHIPISHDATEGGGSRSQAKALKFDLSPEGVSSSGFMASIVGMFGSGNPPAMTQYGFEAPCIVRMRTTRGGKDGKPGTVFGAALHCLPLGKGRSRLLFMTYGLGLGRPLRIIASLKPKWLRHLNSCKVLEQDIQLICAQEDHLARTGETLEQACLPLQTSDTLVVAFRSWLDSYGPSMPFYEGWRSHSVRSRPDNVLDTRWYSHRSRSSRYERHVLISKTSRDALRRLVRAKYWLTSLTALGASVSLTACSGALALPLPLVRGAASCTILASFATIVTHRLEGLFHTNFVRHGEP